MARILIVDDDDGIRESLHFMLENEGYDVSEAANGIEALDYLRTSLEPLIVLLDYRMPRMDGGAVLRTVVAEELYARHVFALLLATPSFVADVPDVQQIVNALHIPIIAKPFDVEQLLEAVTCYEAQLDIA